MTGCPAFSVRPRLIDQGATLQFRSRRRMLTFVHVNVLYCASLGVIGRVSDDVRRCCLTEPEGNCAEVRRSESVGLGWHGHERKVDRAPDGGKPHIKRRKMFSRFNLRLFFRSWWRWGPPKTKELETKDDVMMTTPQ